MESIVQGSEWSVKLRMEHRLVIFENRQPKEVFDCNNESDR